MAAPRNEFNCNEPLGYLITWTTYGTWLPGDERGWHEIGGGSVQPPNPFLWEMNQSRMAEDAFVMDSEMRQLVESTVRRHCQIRRWHLHAVNARSNHVHVVVTSPGYHAKRVRDQLKAWATRKLKVLLPERERFWTEGGGCRCMNRETDLEAAILYVLEAQDRKGREVP